MILSSLLRTTGRTLVACSLAYLPLRGFAQSHHPNMNKAAKATDSHTPGFHPLLAQALSDKGLTNKEAQFVQFNLQPGFTDTVAHRHPCELFVYVLEGTVETRLGNGAPTTYTKGQVMYEKPNIVHSLLRNTSQTEPASLLLVFINTRGVETYKPVHPKAKPSPQK